MKMKHFQTCQKSNIFEHYQNLKTSEFFLNSESYQESLILEVLKFKFQEIREEI